ncbi:MAG TPA: helix-turn-helix transcriptional regulator [Jatrophihabitantaceae bacterium]|jgi:transcriptional regulator with XRE-family HTH domain
MPAKRRTPTVRLRRLSAELRRLRAEAGLTREHVSEQTGINGATLYRIETAQVRPQRRTLVALLDLYRVADPHRSDVVGLLADVGQAGMLQLPSDDLPDALRSYLTFEAEARALRNYESLFLPGLLQTEEYSRAATRHDALAFNPKEVEERVQTRMERKALLTKEAPLELWAIVDEAAIRRLVGGAEVMREQLHYLLSVVEQQPHVTLQVVPFDIGAHPGMNGEFVIMEFAGAEEPEVVYVEGIHGALFLDAEPDIRRYTKVFDNLRAVALGPDQSARLIATAAEQVTEGRL